MCGIVGYIGNQEAVPLVITGLRRMEYRGYDSAGVVVFNGTELETVKCAGKVSDLEARIGNQVLKGSLALGHTRWATHGAPTDQNAHPHYDNSGNIAIIHNGIVENYLSIKIKLLEDGYHFHSETDTEVLAVFIGALYQKVQDLEMAVRLALNEVEGTFGLVVISSYDPDLMIAARRGSPLALGVTNQNEYIVGSDASAIIELTRQVIYLHDNEMAVVRRSGYVTKTIGNEVTHPAIEEIEFDLESIERGGFPHFMLKEIFEQPNTFRDAFRGRLLQEDGNIRLGGLSSVAEKLRNTKRIIITACGTSWHSALVGEYLIESLAQISVEVEYASEFRYRNPIISADDIVIAISQSGETADTLAAIKEAKLKGATVLGIVNRVGSSIARETDAGVYIHAGPEIGVASTKAFTSQVAVLIAIAIYLGRMRNLSASEGKQIIDAILQIPDKIQFILDHVEEIEHIARLYKDAGNFLYLGRGFNFPVALEGALKLKEISYIHAEGYPAAEMKHGPIALIDENMPVVFIAPKDELYDKVSSNIAEVRARNGRVIAIANEGDNAIAKTVDHVIYVPNTISILQPILTVIPLQLLAYHIAVLRGCNVDMPRNLAKSVTVE